MENHCTIAVMLNLEWPLKRHAGILQGVQQYARKQRHWNVVIDEFVGEWKGAGPEPRHRYDGVIARATRPMADYCRSSGTPAVNVWFNSPAQDLPAVYIDYEASGREIAQHFISRGLRRVECLLPARDASYKVEFASIQKTIEEAGGECGLTRVPATPTQSARAWRRTEAIIERGITQWSYPIGIYAGSSHTARQIAQLCEAHELRIPQDVALITAGNEAIFCEELEPMLTAMEDGYDRVGLRAAQLLDRLIAGEPPPRKPLLVPPTGLVVRYSTDFHIVDDDVVAGAMHYISRHGHRELRLPEVAHHVAVSPRMLQIRFREVLGTSFSAEIRRLRLERAKRMLAEGNDSIARIATQVGFTEAKRMAEVFRREVGMSPRQYRRHRRSK